MSSFRGKLVLALVAVDLLASAFPATSSSVLTSHDGGKSSVCVDCGSDGLRKIIGRKGGSFEAQTDIVSKNIVPVRSLRMSPTSRPPSPIRGKRKSQGAPAPPAPPPLIV